MEYFKYTPLNIHLAPKGVVSDVLIGSNIILPSPSRPYQRWSVSDPPPSLRNIGKKESKIELTIYWFIYLVDYRPHNCTSGWFLQTASQIRGFVY